MNSGSEYILEGLVTTSGPEGGTHIAAMGPIVREGFRELILRPFQSSTTFRNLRHRGRGVFHVTDDVQLLATAALGLLVKQPSLRATPDGKGHIIADSCRWYQFEVRKVDDARERSEFRCDVTDHGALREFVGFHRGRHAVIEAAIAASRVQLLGREAVEREVERAQIIVDRTGTDAERETLAMISEFVHQHE